MTVREQIEERERQYLSPYAVASAASRGRVRPEPSDPVRTIFQRDRDRIITPSMTAWPPTCSSLSMRTTTSRIN